MLKLSAQPSAFYKNAVEKLRVLLRRSEKKSFFSHKKRMKVLIPFFLFVTCSRAETQANPNGNTSPCTGPIYVTTKATVILTGDGNDDFYGTIELDEQNGLGPVTLTGTIQNLTQGLHGFHIHEKGNIRHGCDSAGDHFNPDGFDHAGLNNPQRHAGDLGNIVANAQGIATVNKVDNAFTLNGDYSVIGRALVVHQDPDDAGMGNQADSKTTGHAGKRVACGVIGISQQQLVTTKK